MPTSTSRLGTYAACFPVVTAAVWDKYEGHEWIKEVEVLRRFVDAQGRLHSRRLLTLNGQVPLLLRPFIGIARPVYLVEDIVIDLARQRMDVQTSNVNFLSILQSTSRSYYVPASGDPSRTTYEIFVQTRAFPNDAREDSESRFGAIGRKLEGFIGNALLGNIKTGEAVLSGWIDCMRQDCVAGKTRAWICGMLHK